MLGQPSFRAATPEVATWSDDDLCDELRFAAFWCGETDAGDPVRRLLDAVVRRLEAEHAAPRGVLPDTRVDADLVVREAEEHAARMVLEAEAEAARLHHDARRALDEVADGLRRLGDGRRALRLALHRLQVLEAPSASPST